MTAPRVQALRNLKLAWAARISRSRLRWAAFIQRASERETHYCLECHLPITGFLQAENHMVFEHSWARPVAQELLAIRARERRNVDTGMGR